MNTCPALWCALLAGCATVERYEVRGDASPDEVVGAAGEAARRLGSDAQPTEDGTLVLKAVRGPVDDVKVTSTRSGVLELQSSGSQGLGKFGAAIALGTRHLLDDRPAVAPAWSPRSHAAVFALDLLVPFAGGVLADAGDPFGPNWTQRFGSLTMDLVGAGMLLESQLIRGVQFDVTYLAVVGVSMWVINRVISVMADWWQVSRRNRAITSGFDLSVMPLAMAPGAPP